MSGFSHQDPQKCWICQRYKGQGVNGCIGHYEGMSSAPIDWQARCLQAMLERDQLKKTETQTYALYSELKAELAAIKSRLEWRVLRNGKEIRIEEHELPKYRSRISPIQSRYAAGPWVPVAKEGE